MPSRLAEDPHCVAPPAGARGSKAGRLGLGLLDLASLRPPRDGTHIESGSLAFGEPFIEDGIWTTEVVNVDRFGNATTNLPGGTVLDESEFGATAAVEVDGLRFDVALHRTYGQAPEDEPILTIGSAGFAELSMREASLADRYGVEVGDQVEIQFFPREDPDAARPE